MKKIILLIIAIFISYIATYAGNENNTIHNQISRQMKIPSSLKEGKLDEKVTVEFRISGEGKAEVIRVNTGNAELKQYITSEFQSIKFNNTDVKSGISYFIDINFKVL